MSTYRKLMTVGCAAVLALGLAACGNGDDDDTAGAPTTMEPMEAMEPTAEEQLAALREEISALRAQLGIEDDDDLSDSVADLQSEVASLKMQIQDAEDAEAEAEAERVAADNAAAGKALKAAMGQTPLSNLRADSTITPALHSLTSAGLAVGIPNADSTASTASPRMKAGTSAGSLGGWAGTNYAHKNAGTKVSNSAIVYNNRAAPKSYPIASRYADTDNVPTNAGTYVPATRTLPLGNAADLNIKADMFPTAGETTFTPTAPSNEVLVPGTYQGASGDYRCTGTCTAEATTAGIELSADWVFVHDTGAMVSIMDPSYLYFGWWLQKNKDDEPTSASAFTGVGGATIAALTASPLELTGSATYEGHAAGKFAINDPLTGGDAGHFTADATLTARFGEPATATANNANGLTGTLDNFMANDEAVPWSVSLLRANLNATGGTEAFDDPDTNPLDESATATVWSIDGNSAAASGSWSAQMYDEKPGTAPPGDGSNVPTSVTGTFQSEFGSTHSMVGAFGATKE